MIVLSYPEGATPLDPDEAAGLIPQHIYTQSELNEWEQGNILEAELWLSKHRIFQQKLLDIAFIKKMHLRMFDKTWRWAGQFRRSDKNIGVDWLTISGCLKLLCDDVQYQLEYQAYKLDEIAARFHHRLVAIHPFSNGNGRHARLMTDMLLLSQHQARFTWGQQNLYKPSVTRRQYIDALRAADEWDYRPLLDFVRR